LAIFGLLVLRHIETVKAEVAKQSDFKKRWADGFFETCQEFMRAVEHCMALLNFLQSNSDPNSEFGTRCQKECTELFPQISEFELRLRRYVTLAPSTGNAMGTHAKSIVEYLAEMVRKREGSFDNLIQRIHDFNRATMSAHREIFGIGDPPAQ
jgi:hypothetical protein